MSRRADESLTRESGASTGRGLDSLGLSDLYPGEEVKQCASDEQRKLLQASGEQWRLKIRGRRETHE